jgi:outer membrane murein-binding lipoprotein Lpp
MENKKKGTMPYTVGCFVFLMVCIIGLSAFYIALEQKVTKLQSNLQTLNSQISELNVKIVELYDERELAATIVPSESTTPVGVEDEDITFDNIKFEVKVDNSVDRVYGTNQVGISIEVDNRTSRAIKYLEGYFIIRPYSTSKEYSEYVTYTDIEVPKYVNKVLYSAIAPSNLVDELGAITDSVVNIEFTPTCITFDDGYELRQ